MSQVTTTVRSTVATAANTDTALLTTVTGQRYRLLQFYVTNEGAAQAAGMDFELRLGATILSAVGLDNAAAPIGQTSKPVPLGHEFVGVAGTNVLARNLVALNAASNVAYTLVYATDAPDGVHRASGDAF